jgi:hypothetical protein
MDFTLPGLTTLILGVFLAGMAAGCVWLSHLHDEERKRKDAKIDYLALENLKLKREAKNGAAV